MEKEALLIVDMSNDFVADDGPLTVGKPAQEIVPYIQDLATRFLAEGNVVVVSMDAHQPNDPHFELWPPHNIVGTEGQQLYGDLYDWFQDNKDRKSTRLNSSHVAISYAVFCLKKRKTAH